MIDRYNPWDHASALGLRVVRRDLPAGMRAAWHAPSRTVLLDRGLSQRERRCSLAHEVVHAERHDSCRQTARIEAEVHLVAARRLITLEALADALCWTKDPGVLVDELWVDRVTLECRWDGLDPHERAWLEQRFLVA